MLKLSTSFVEEELVYVPLPGSIVPNDELIVACRLIWDAPSPTKQACDSLGWLRGKSSSGNSAFTVHRRPRVVPPRPLVVRPGLVSTHWAAKGKNSRRRIHRPSVLRFQTFYACTSCLTKCTNFNTLYFGCNSHIDRIPTVKWYAQVDA